MRHQVEKGTFSYENKERTKREKLVRTKWAFHRFGALTVLSFFLCLLAPRSLFSRQIAYHKVTADWLGDLEMSRLSVFYIVFQITFLFVGSLLTYTLLTKTGSSVLRPNPGVVRMSGCSMRIV